MLAIVFPRSFAVRKLLWENSNDEGWGLNKKNRKIKLVISQREIPWPELGNIAKWVRARIELVQQPQCCTADLSALLALSHPASSPL